MQTDRGDWHILKPLRDTYEGPPSLASTELWGRELYDTNGRRLGTIDSIVRPHGGPVRAIVRTDGRPRRFVFIDLGMAAFDGDAIVVPITGRESSAAEEWPTPRSGFVWPLTLRRRG